MAYSPRSSRSPMKRNRFRPVGMSNPNVHAGHSDELDGERLAFLNTALEAIPGITLRERFAPIVRLKKNMLMRKKHTQTRLRNETRPYDRVVTDALTALAKSLTEAAGDAIHDAAFPLNVNTFVELLRDKVEPVSYSAGSVLLYPNEPPESMFVYMLTNGAVSVTHYQQVRRAAAMERKQYITSGSESVFLCGGGLMLENLIAQQQQENAGAGDFNDAVSFSNVTTAIQRSLKRASRIIGQPTLQPGRSEMLKAPAVICGGDALGLAPHKCASCLATTCATSKGGDTILEEFVDVLRLRMIDVHEALMELATREMEARLRSQESGDNPFFADVTQAWFAVPYGMMPPRGTQRTLAEFISAARIKVLTTHYPQNELSMRQSWLLQDTPPPTVRSLISNLTARTFMPGEVIACQHCTTSATRQLCFLRRGEIHIEEAPPLTHGKGKHAPHLGGTVRCTCGGFQGRTLEAINAGVSFGELSVLFGESRNYTLRAATVCDVWCLSHNNFAQTMRRDDALRTSLVAKAAALRIKWLGEQRFTTALAEHLRNSTELFRPFADPVMRLIQERIEPVVYSPGSLIASTSTRCTEMIFIISGKVASICDGVANFGPGDVLGEGCLIPHRWPISLAARTMVEGWTLNRDRLNDALERADKLHSHSGIITNLAHILIKDIFGAPLPELKTDAVGRQQMPIVAAAPGGQSYPIYARQVAEVQLKATCFLYRDFVKWEDINYGTMESSKSGSAQERAESEAIARDYAVRRLRERLGVAPRARNASVANMLDAAVARKSQANPRRSTVTNVEAPPPPTSRTTAVAVGSGSAAAKAKNASVTKKIPGGAAAYRKKRRNNTGSCAFLVDSDVTRTPFAPITVKRDTSPSRAGARVVAMESDNVAIGVLQRRPSTLQALMKRIRRNYRHPRGLHRFSKMLEERDRVMASEARQEAAIEKKLYGTDAITSARSELSDPNRGALIATAPVDHALMATSPLPPVHVFLSAEKPRAELTVNEAISIGYVMQLPDTQCIQACVSFVDPDVTVGLPHHRARRYAMAVTPNNRYTKHNFLFAASTFDDAIKRAAEEEAKAELERAARAKSHKLYTILQNNLQTQGELSERRTQSDGPFGGFTAQTVATEGAVTTADLGAAEQPLSRLGSASGTPMQQSFSHLGGGLGSGEAAARSRTGSFSVVPGSLTPFRGGEAVRKKKEEAFLRLLNRTPLKAMDLLFAKYHVPWRTTTDEPHSTTGPEDVVERLRRVRAELPLRQQPGLAVITPRSARCGWQHATAAAPSLELSGTLNQTARVKGVDGYLQSKDAVFYLDRFGALNAASLADRPGIIILPIGASAQLGGMGASPSAHLELSMSSMGGSQWKRAGTLEGSLMMIPSALDAGSPSRITTDGMNAPVDGFDALTPKDFVMPDDEEANAMMRRIQRDVDGLNAVARHQTRERERHNRQEKRAKLVEELLANPTTEEQLLLDDWRQSYHLQTKEGTQRIAIPKALIPEAGVDFLQREVRRLNHLDGPVADSQRRATTSGVEEWQEDLVGGGGYKKSGSAARRVVAAVGTAQLGYRATPLTNPTAHLSAAEYEAYVAEREALFQAYTRRDASMPDAGIPGFVVSRPTTARPATNIKAAAQEEEKEEYIDSDYEPSPVKPTPSS